MERETGLKILNEVRQSYNQIAEDFSRTRSQAWKEFRPLADYAKIGDKILDLGCGNGRFLELFKGKAIEYTGIDISEKLIEIARKKYPNQEFQVFDGLKIPFEENHFDKVFCLAVLHHIPAATLRNEFLQEIKRILKPGSKLILSTWYLWNKITFWQLFFKFTLKKILGKLPLDFFDMMEPWGKISERYFHNFRKGELKILLQENGFKIERFYVLTRGQKNKNLLVVASKLNHE